MKLSTLFCYQKTRLFVGWIYDWLQKRLLLHDAASHFEMVASDFWKHYFALMM